MKITILGAGAWGTALAIALANRHQICLWGRNQHAMQEAASRRENLAYLPGCLLPDGINITADFDSAIQHVLDDGSSGLLLLGTSVSGLRPLLQRLKVFPIQNIVWLCKGFEEQTQRLPHQIVQEVLGTELPIGSLSGPSFAHEVAHGMPCALTIGSSSQSLCDKVVNAAHGRQIRIYSSDDLIGVEVGGAVKNILAIATGVIDGMGLGMNARAALITRGLAEITRLGIALGGRAETFMGLTGVGDLILTCTGDLSRNRKVGLSLAQGKNLTSIVAELGHVAEGVRCAQAVRTLAAQHGVDMPITNAVAGVLFDGVAPRDMVNALLSRDPRGEAY